MKYHGQQKKMKEYKSKLDFLNTFTTHI